MKGGMENAAARGEFALPLPIVGANLKDQQWPEEEKAFRHAQHRRDECLGGKWWFSGEGGLSSFAQLMAKKHVIHTQLVSARS